MVRKVAVAVDGSDASGDAFEVAVQVARALAAPLAILSVVPITANSLGSLGWVGGPYGAPTVVGGATEEQRRYQTEVVEREKEEASRSGVRDVRREVLDGNPAVVLLDWLAREPVELAVVGARGRSASARLLLGSVSSALVSQAACKVLVVRGPSKRNGAPAPRSIHKVVVAVDGSLPSMLASDTGIQMGAALKVPLRAVTVAPERVSAGTSQGPSSAPGEPLLANLETLLQGVKARATAAGVLEVSTQVLRGHPVDAILNDLSADPNNLLVVGSRGLSPTRRLVMGSVSTSLLHLVPSMILVVKGRPGPGRASRGKARSVVEAGSS